MYYVKVLETAMVGGEHETDDGNFVIDDMHITRVTKVQDFIVDDVDILKDKESVVAVDFICHWRDPAVHRPAPAVFCIATFERVFVIELRQNAYEHFPLDVEIAQYLLEVFDDHSIVKVMYRPFDKWCGQQLHRLLRGSDPKAQPFAIRGLKKNFLKKIFGLLARCEFLAKIGLRFWILVG